MEIYDLIIIGAGPGGLSAALYAARYKLNTIIIGKDNGGIAATAHKICNFPSYIEIQGVELMQKIISQVKSLGVEILNEEIFQIKKRGAIFIVMTRKKEYEAKKIIFAGGTKRSKLGAKNEERFIGKGVSYCASCDASFFKDKKVAVIGGGNAALTAALLLNEYSKEIYIIYRGKSFVKADPSWVELVKKNKKIKIRFNEEVIEINGKDKVNEIKLNSGKKLDVDGVFIEIGGIPDTYVLSSLKVKRDKKGYIITDKCQRTNINGLYAAGDITNNVLKQIVTAAGEGATAAFCVYKEIQMEKSKS